MSEKKVVAPFSIGISISRDELLKPKLWLFSWKFPPVSEHSCSTTFNGYTWAPCVWKTIKIPMLQIQKLSMGFFYFLFLYKKYFYKMLIL